MSDGLDELVRTLLHEGWALSADRAAENTFGVVFPRAWAACREDALDHVRLECVVRAPAEAELGAAVHFLQCSDRRVPVERSVAMPRATLEDLAQGLSATFVFDELHGRVSATAQRLDGRLARVVVWVENETELHPDDARAIARDEALRLSLLSTHVVLRLSEGRFVSPLEDAGAEGEAVRACRNVNVWPVPAGSAGEALLGAALVPSAGLELDACEVAELLDTASIEEALLLHVGSLSDEERAALAAPEGAGTGER